MISFAATVLPIINALLNALSTCFLLLGYRAICAKRIKEHYQWMLSALVVSTVFLMSYLTRMALTGPHLFPVPGLIKRFYLLLLTSHVFLAIVLVPLVLRTVYLALTQQFVHHRRWAQWTFPIWLYVSITGVVVYVMLYHVAEWWC